MIWFAWRQFRTQALVALGGLVITAAVVVPTGLRLHHWYGSGLGCTAAQNCDSASAASLAFGSNYSWLQTALGNIVINLFPAVIGVFWGAPLVARELENGTFRLAWTQSVTRSRWLAARVGVVLLTAVAAAAVLTWLITWWFTPFDKIAANKFDGSVFSERDIVPIGYTAFAVALGVFAGTLIRRVLPAMAVTLFGFIGARVAVLLWVRPHFAAALHASAPLPPPPDAPGGLATKTPLRQLVPSGSWEISRRLVDAQGHAVHGPIRISFDDQCAATNSCLNGYRQAVTYQPAHRYWPFQWAEFGLFTGVAILLVAFCFWWLTGHRLPTRSGRADAVTPAAGADRDHVEAAVSSQ